MSACNGKHRYESKAVAVSVMKRTIKKGVNAVYKCDECGLWHIGTQLKTQNKKKKSRYEPSVGNPKITIYNEQDEELE